MAFFASVLLICCVVWIGPMVVKELKRIVESSEITKYVVVVVSVLSPV